MYIKTSIYEVLSEDQKDSEDVSADTSIFKKVQIVFLQFEVKVGKVNFDLNRSN
jgi:hypothetical protein